MTQGTPNETGRRASGKGNSLGHVFRLWVLLSALVGAWISTAETAETTSPRPRTASPLSGTEPLQVVDRIVAVVDEDPIFLSDIRRAAALGLMGTPSEDDSAAMERQILDQLIDQRLRFHEVERYDVVTVPEDDVDGQLAQIRSGFVGEGAFEGYLRSLGLDEHRLRHLLRRQLRVLLYIEERLGPRIFVDLDDIRAYYEGELRPRAERDGMVLPPLDEVREDIRALLREIRLNEEIERWTRELRQQAEIVDHLDRPERPLPPLVQRLERDDG